MAESGWYYARGGQQVGPITWEALASLARAGQVVPGDLVWTHGMANWQPAGQTQGLFDAGAGQAPAGVDPSRPSYAAPAGAMHAGYGAAGQYPGAAYPQGYPPQQGMLGYYAPVPASAAYAGFWLRFCAAIIDGIILRIAGAAIGLAFGVSVAQGVGVGPHPPMSGAYAAYLVVMLVINWLYFTLQEASVNQATLGKMAVGIVVTDEHGRRIGFGRANGRYWGKLVSALIVMIGYIMAAFTERKQALHDIMAGTLVVKKA